MAGRSSNPGELGPHGDLRDGGAYLSKQIRGQITTVDPVNGKINVDLMDVVGTKELTSPVLWYSATGRTSAWGRYMPMGKETINIAFRNNGSPVFVGYDATNTKDGRPGWNNLADAQKEGGVPGFGAYRALKRGEYDFKSSGDAYIHGSNAGTLLLAGGQAFFKLEKMPYRISSKAGTYKHESGANIIRFGTVYRKATALDIDETAVPPSTFNEYMVDINQILPGGIRSVQSRALIHFGDILLTPANIPELSSLGLPLRARISLGDVSDTLEVFNFQVDAGGNVKWAQKNAVPPVTNMTIGLASIVIDGKLGTMKLGWTTPDVSVAIANHLQTLYTQLKVKLDTFDAHIHPTGLGPSGPPAPMIAAPAWDPLINSTKLTIPDG